MCGATGMQGCSGITHIAGSRVLGEEPPQVLVPLPSKPAWRQEPISCLALIQTITRVGSAAAWVRETKQLDGGRGSGLHTQAKHSPTSPAGKRLYRREKALDNDGWSLVAAFLPVCRASWEPFSSLGPSSTLWQLIPFLYSPASPKQHGHLWAACLEQTLSPAHGQALLGRVFTGSSQHRGGRTVSGQPGALPGFIPWFRHSQEMLTCGAIPGSSRAGLGGLQGVHALGFTGRVVGHFL